MAKVAALFLFFATALAAVSVGTAPAAAPEAAVQQQELSSPTPLHSLTGVVFHVSAVGF
ncbi:MAG TPA: hypothetical protein VGI89_04420 [Rhizomicrobium sp.]|jgi:hypothetical protein